MAARPIDRDLPRERAEVHHFLIILSIRYGPRGVHPGGGKKVIQSARVSLFEIRGQISAITTRRFRSICSVTELTGKGSPAQRDEALKGVAARGQQAEGINLLFFTRAK